MLSDTGVHSPELKERIKASILVAGGLMGNARPEADPINYVTRVRVPTLMLNGKYDTLLVPETSQKPMFGLLGARQVSVTPVSRTPSAPGTAIGVSALRV